MRPSTVLIPLILTTAAAPAVAGDRVEIRQYTARYDAQRDLYCLRLFGDGQAANPRPLTRGLQCRHQADWARQGVIIHHRQRPTDLAAR